MDHVDQIAKIAEVAGKEFAIEQALEKMEKDWTPVNLEVSQLTFWPSNITSISNFTTLIE